ncbi:MAG: YajG family lipoprotein [Oceanobacter sp.]
MHKLQTGVLAAVMLAGLGGCALAPQKIDLNQNATAMSGQISAPRNALIRVVDQRDGGEMSLGHRGGPKPEEALLNASVSVRQALTIKLKQSLEALGFGLGTPQDEVKVQLDIDRFAHACNSPVVTECSLDIGLRLEVSAGRNTFSKGFSVRESRTVLVAPGEQLNEEWINEVLNRLWQHMFKDPELRVALGL